MNGTIKKKLHRSKKKKKKNERIVRVFKILELLVKNECGTNGNCLKRTLKSGTHSYFQKLGFPANETLREKIQKIFVQIPKTVFKKIIINNFSSLT